MKNALNVMSRRALILTAGLSSMALVARAAQPERSALARSTSLAAELNAALALKRCLVVMVSLEGCPICRSVRESHLFSLAEQGQPVVQVEMLGKQPLLAFNGMRTTHGGQVQAWNARVAPTVIFFGRGGAEVAERLDGSYLADFYGAYLDQRLKAANSAV